MGLQNKRKLFKVKDTLTKQNIVLNIIKKHPQGITTQWIAKLAKINYRTARKWAEYLRRTKIIGRTKIGNYKVYFFKEYGKRFHLAKFLEEQLNDK